MLYAIIATDVENSLEKRLSVRPAHVERLKALQAEGRIVLAGPYPAVDSNDRLTVPPSCLTRQPCQLESPGISPW